jgi:protein-S-isoprenylcysteine O-methyltransferase Ste14
VVCQLLLYGATAGAGLRGRPWPRRARGLARVGGGALGVAGAALVVGGSAALGRALTANPLPRSGMELRKNGLYALVRHPIYGGALLAAVGWSLFTSPTALIPTAATAVVLDLKSRREEAWLGERHRDYPEYRAAVARRFLPRIW